MRRLMSTAAFVLLAASLVACSGARATLRTVSAPAPTVPELELKTYTRLEFNQAVMGKTPTQLLELLGKPEFIVERHSRAITDPAYEALWSYTNRQVRVTDPATGTTYPGAEVRIFRGVVVTIKH